MQQEPPVHGFRTFLTVWITQSVSSIGSMLTFVAITVWVTQVLYPLPEQKPELGMALSAISLSFGLPAVFLAPIAGAFVDRHDRRRTMLVCDLLMTLVAAILTLLLMTQSLGIVTLVILMAALSAANAFHAAAFDTSYSMLVPDHLLSRANGMMQTSWSLANILGPMLAPVLIALPAMARQGDLGAWGAALSSLSDGTALVTAVDTVTFAISAMVLLFVQIPSPKRTDLAPTGKPKTSLWADVREGATFVVRRRPLLWLLASFTVANFCLAAMGVLMPLVVKFSLTASLTSLGLTLEQAIGRLGSMAGLGGMLGGIIISLWGGLRSRRVLGVLVPMILQGLAQVVYGFSPAFYLTVAMAFLIQFGMPAMNAHSQAIWQSQTPREMQGRVFAVRRLIAWISVPIANALAGLLGGLLNPGAVVGVLGALYAVAAVLQLFNPTLMRVEEHKPLDRVAGAVKEAGM